MKIQHICRLRESFEEEDGNFKKLTRNFGRQCLYERHDDCVNDLMLEPIVMTSLQFELWSNFEKPGADRMFS